MTFVPALVLPLWGWSELHQPLHLYGLGVMVLAALLIVPAVLLLVLFLPTAWTAIVPCSWRKNHRQRHGRENCRSAYIPRFLRRLVLAADRYRCVSCGYSGDLQIDHVFPWSLGGLTVFYNLVTLCSECNRAKSNYWQFRRSGNVVYVPFRGYAVPGRAAAILASERVRRRNLLRLLRAAWALG
jgi:hypothetical protein